MSTGYGVQTCNGISGCIVNIDMPITSMNPVDSMRKDLHIESLRTQGKLHVQTCLIDSVMSNMHRLVLTIPTGFQ